MSNSAFSPSVLTIPSSTSGSGGQGELNLITNPVAAVNLDGWVGAGRGTSGGPLNPTIGTYFTVLNTAGSESSTSGAYSVLSFPIGLQNKKLKVEFYFTSPAADTFKVSVYKGTTRVPLTTDVSGTTSLPQNTTGKFTAYFDSDSSGTWTVSITRTAGTGGTALQFTNVVVGPGIQPQGAVVGEWQSYTPTFSAGYGTVTGISAQYRRVGSSMELVVNGTAGTVAASVASISIPSGFTIPSSAVNTILGSATTVYSTASGTNNSALVFVPSGATNTVGLTNVSDGASTKNLSQLLVATVYGTGAPFSVRFAVPIAEWAGSGTVQLAQNDVEYAWNSGNVTAANAQDNTSFAYGPSGTPILAYNSTTLTGTAQTSFLVQFQTPIQPGDKLTIEIGNATTGWTDFSSFQGVFTGQAAAVYGCQVIATSRTQARVYFGNAGQWSSGATYASAGAAWSGLSAYNWRVRKSSAGAAVGFGIVSPGVSSGLVAAAGLPGRTDGLAVPTGYVGEVITATGSAQTLTTGQYNDGGVAVQTLQPGTWAVYAGGYFNPSSASTVVARNLVGIGTATGNSSSGMVIPSETTSCPGSTGGQPNMITAPPAIKVLSVATQFYVKVYSDFSVAGQTGLGYFKAIRIA